MRTQMILPKGIRRVITFETNSLGDPMPVVLYRKKSTSTPVGVTSPAAAKAKAKTLLDKVVDSQVLAATEFRALSDKAGQDWVKDLGKNVVLAVVKGGSAFETK
jgi:hypothetical protein